MLAQLLGDIGCKARLYGPMFWCISFALRDKASSRTGLGQMASSNSSIAQTDMLATTAAARAATAAARDFPRFVNRAVLDDEHDWRSMAM